MDTTLKVGALCAAVTYIVEFIKSWIPAKNKTPEGLVFARKGKKHPITLPNQAVWPTVSALVGMGLFVLIHFDPIGIGGYAGEAISGFTAGTAGGATVFRVKNVAGVKMGGTTETDAQHTGPSAQKPD